MTYQNCYSHLSNKQGYNINLYGLGKHLCCEAQTDWNNFVCKISWIFQKAMLTYMYVYCINSKYLWYMVKNWCIFPIIFLSKWNTNILLKYQNTNAPHPPNPTSISFCFHVTFLPPANVTLQLCTWSSMNSLQVCNSISLLHGEYWSRRG